MKKLKSGDLYVYKGPRWNVSRSFSGVYIWKNGDTHINNFDMQSRLVLIVPGTIYNSEDLKNPMVNYCLCLYKDTICMVGRSYLVKYTPSMVLSQDL